MAISIQHGFPEGNLRHLQKRHNMDNLIRTETGKKKILILSAPIGSGHRMAAEAIGEALSRLGNTDVVQGNIFHFFPSILGTIFLRTYEKILKFCPCLYAFTYRWGNQGGTSLGMRSLINTVLLRLGKSYIDGVQPDIVFSTHATSTGIMSLYKEKYDPNLWLGVIVTDFTVHRWLVCKGVDAYFLADGKLFSQIKDKIGNKKPSLYAFGIPVRRDFSEEVDITLLRKKLREEFGWEEDAFVCLLAGGGGGMLPMETILRQMVPSGTESIANLNDSDQLDKKLTTEIKHFRLIAVTGHNEALQRRLRSLETSFFMTREQDNIAGTLNYRRESSLAVLGFTDQMPRLMRGADVVITKAGGVSLAECLACGAHIVLYDPLPGQEQANSIFVQREYGVESAADAGQLADVLRRIAAVPVEERLQLQEDRQKAFGHPDAMDKIVEFTNNLFKLNVEK